MARCDRGGTSLVFDWRRDHPELVYAGRALPPNEDIGALCDARTRGIHESQPNLPVPQTILPQSGWGYGGSPAIALARNGVASWAELALMQVQAGPDAITFALGDAAGDVAAAVTWRIAASGLVVTETRVANTGGGPISIVTCASLALPLPGWATRVERWSGRWAGEMRAERSSLARGGVGGESFGGRPGFDGLNWARLEEEAVSETAGLSLAAHLAWSGDAILRIERNADGHAVLLMGARLDPGEVTLAPGEQWTSPQAMFAIGDAGRSATRHAFHAHVGTEILPRPKSDRPRKVHLNSWEALGFDLSLDKLKCLIDDAAALGIERFVLDDGWFLGRRDDTARLGDWQPDPQIFPDGLGPLIEHVHARGMDFGLWVEPEMVSPDSDLYRARPDWCLHDGGTARPTQRQQLVLDLTRAEVATHLFATLDALLRDHRIAYLKWDHNRDLFPRAGRGHAQTRALYALLDRLRAAHPGVEIETCASGGGRVDLAILQRCTRYWASDNNDAIERLRINRSWFDFLPLKATGNHVGPSPNPITGRRLAMDFRAKVALFGHMGVEANPAAMTADDRACLAAHIALYKQWRDVLHRGALTAIGCDDPGVYGWLAFDGERGLALAAQTAFAANFDVAPIRLFGLCAEQQYRVQLLEPWRPRAARYLAMPTQWREGLLLSGRALSDMGLALPLTHPEAAWLIAVERMA
jgi:alpha-galactosidase